MRTAANLTALAVILQIGSVVPASAATSGSIAGKVKTRPRKYSRNVVVFIEKAKTKTRPTKEVMDQKNLIFIPHVLPVVKGSTVKFLNSDNVRHNVFSPDNEKYNLGTWPKGKTKSHTYNRLGVYTQLCNVHPEMEAFVVVLQNGHFAVTDRKGNYTIKDVPPGSYTVKTWGKKLKPASQKITVEASKVTSLDLSPGRK